MEKVMTAFTALTIRKIVSYANENNIKRDDIVSLMKNGNEYVLIYYYSDGGE